MKVAIIEDEIPAFRRLQKVLEAVNPAIEILEVLDSVEESVSWLSENAQLPDLILMDIQLNDGISFEIFEQVQIDKPVIFTTAFDDYMLKAFKVNSIDYLLKPVAQEELARSLRKYEQLRNSFREDMLSLNQIIPQLQLDVKTYKTRFLVKHRQQLLSVPTKDIAAFYTKNGLVYLRTHTNKSHVISQSLEEVSELIDPADFFRVNRQVILCFSCIKSVHPWSKNKLLVDTHLSFDKSITVSADKAAAFKKWLGY